MKSAILTSLTIAAVLIIVGSAPATAGEKHELSSMNLTGTVSSVEKEFVGKDGNSFTRTIYYLQVDDQRVQLPEHRGCKKDDAPTIALADYVGARVTVTFKGYVKRGKDGSENTYVHQITAIERMSSSSQT